MLEKKNLFCASTIVGISVSQYLRHTMGEDMKSQQTEQDGRGEKLAIGK